MKKKAFLRAFVLTVRNSQNLRSFKNFVSLKEIFSQELFDY